MSVVGIDFGNESCVIAIARKGIIEVVDNEVSHRKTPTIVGYQSNERNIGENGLSSQTSNYKHTITEIKRLLGRRLTHPLVQQDIHRLNYKISAAEDGRILIETQSAEGPIKLTAEQVFGAMLTRLRRTTERKLGGQRVVDVVLSCPPYFDDAERQALIDAAQIAGLNVLRIMNETTAVALNYGILRNLSKEPIRVVFYDMGHASTNVAVVSFVEGKLTVLGTASDRSLGGRDFDTAMVRHFANEFKSKYKIDVMSNQKAILRLQKSCSKLKTVLSANRQAPLNIECIMDDTDVSSKLTRDELEEMWSEVLARVARPCQEVLEATNTTLDQVHSIEIIGGGTRVPAVRGALEAFFKKPISQTLNGDETVARGCALQCAMISPAFKVRNFDVQDVAPYPIELCWGPVNDTFMLEDCEFKDKLEIFSRFNAVPCVKAISFLETEPFQIVLRYRNCNLVPPGTERFLYRYIIDVPPPNEESEKTKVKVHIRLDLHGQVSLTRATLVEDLKPEEVDDAMDTAPISPTPENAAGKEGGDGSGDASPEPAAGTDDIPMENGDSEPQSPPSADSDQNMDENSTDGNAAPEGASDEGKADGEKVVEGDKTAEEADKKNEPKKKRKKKTPIVFNSVRRFGRDDDELKDFREKEVAFAHQDKLVAETAEKRNELESYVYEIRGRVEYELKDFETEAGRSKFLEALQKTENWLYEDGYDAQKSEYVRRLKDLRKRGDRIVKRAWESEHRDDEIGSLKASSVKYQMFLTACEAEEKYSHLEQEEKDKVKAQVDKTESWIVESLQKQDRKKKHEDPVFTASDCRMKKTELENLCNPIMNKPKPKPKEEPKKEEAKPEGEKEMKDDGEKAADATPDKPANPDEAEVDDMDVD